MRPPGPGELVAASMSHASVMLGLEVAQCCLAGAKSAVMAATVRKEEATVLVLRVRHVYFQDLHSWGPDGEPGSKTHRTQNSSPLPRQAASSSFSLSGLYTAFSMSFWLQQLLLLETEKGISALLGQ